MTLVFIAGSVSDLKQYKIHNEVIIFGWLAGLVYNFMQEGWIGVWIGLLAVLFTILVAWPLFLVRIMGAGDIKLFSVVSCFYGVGFLTRTLVLMLLMAGAYSFYRLCKTKQFYKRFHYLIQYIGYDRKSGYYRPERDGQEMVISLTPFLAAAYYMVLVWENFVW